MEKEYFVKLCLSVYQVTDLFPEKEPLRFKIREQADDILADLVLTSQKNPGLSSSSAKDISKGILEKIEILNAYFKVAKVQNWVDTRNFDVLSKEYNKVKEEIGEIEKEKQVLPKPAVVKQESFQKPSSVSQDFNGNGYSERQKKLLRILEKKSDLQVRDFQKFFPEVSKRTIQRDLEYLITKKVVDREGEQNNIFYRLGASEV